MKKILRGGVAVLLLGVMLSFSGCLSLLLVPTYQNRAYMEPDMTRVEYLIDSLNDLCQDPANERSLYNTYAELNQLIVDYSTSYRRAMIDYYLNTSAENLRRYQETEAFFIELQPAIQQLEKGLFSSPSKALFEEWLGAAYVASVLNQPEITEEQTALSRQESELVSEYSQLDLSDPADQTRADALYLELLDIRQQYAEACGYDSYVDYAFAEVYIRDYDLDDLAVLYAAVRADFPALYAQALSGYEPFFLGYSESEILNVLRTYTEQIDPDMPSVVDWMVRYDLYDFSVSSTKMQNTTSFVIEFPQYGDAYLFLQPGSSLEFSDLQTVIHEFGHYNEVFASDSLKELGMGYQSMDLAEIHSTGLELLFQQFYDDFLPASAVQAATDQLLANYLWAVVSSAAFSEFEFYALTAEEPSVADLEAEFDRLMAAYGISTSYSYRDIPHFYQSPAYYVSYLTASMAAGAIWTSETPEETYLNVVSYGTDNYFCAVLEACGLPSVFSASTAEAVADRIGALLAA